MSSTVLFEVVDIAFSSPPFFFLASFLPSFFSLFPFSPNFSFLSLSHAGLFSIHLQTSDTPQPASIGRKFLLSMNVYVAFSSPSYSRHRPSLLDISAESS